MYRAVKGTRDILPEHMVPWYRVEESVRRMFPLYGFREIRTPILEETALFQRGIGEATDIVSKEMYTFPDRKGRSLTLRPENTAPVVRACLEHQLLRGHASLKLFYIGPMFRYERPQQGRLRQFSQVGAEVIGREDALADAELIEMVMSWLRALGVEEIALRLNSVGCAACRPSYVAALRRALEPYLDRLCEDCRRRFVDNPLRILDCKVPEDQALLAHAPAPADHLCAACREHFAEVRRLLGKLGVEPAVDPRLVRGLDYYTRTTFEVAPREASGAQSAILGGGRYDGLFEALGGPPTPALGFAVGIERLLAALPQEASAEPPLDLFVVHLGEAGFGRALEVAARLRGAGVRVDLEGAGRAMKAQLREAARRGARYALILGEQEIQSGLYGLKRLSDGEQSALTLEAIDRRLADERGSGRGRA
jgi:histidyl-tRNA synthetase